MAVMKWDTESQAFVETRNIPMRYDPETEAWLETTGKAYVNTAGAWTERWSPIKYLYNGGFCDGTTALVNRRPNGTGGKLTYTEECITLTVNPNNTSGCGWWSFNKIDLTPYKKMKAKIYAEIHDNDLAQFNINVNYGSSVLVVNNMYVKDYGYKIIEAELDISSIKQEAYPAIGMYEATVKYYKIWLEK